MALARPLVRPRFAKASAVILLLLLPVVAHAVWDYVEARRLRTRIEAIAARGEPLTERQTGPERLSGGAEEADRYYRAAAALVTDVYDDIPSATWYRVRAAGRDGVWPPELLAIVRGRVALNGDALDYLDRAAALPFDGFSPGTSYTYQMGQFMTLASLADWRAVVRAADGDGDGAIASIYTEARLTRALRWPPSFHALPFALSHGQHSAAALARLGDALAEIDRDDRLREHFLQLRAMLLDEVRADRAVWSSPARTLRVHRFVASIDQYSALAQAAARPWPEPLRAVPDLSWSNGQGPINRREYLEQNVRFWARFVQSVRCARLRVRGSLKLVDPFTGRFLELADCKL